MLSKATLFSAGLASYSSVEAFSFQDFIPDKVKDYVDQNVHIDVDFNGTMPDPGKIIQGVREQSEEAYQYGKGRLGHEIERLRNKTAEFDLNKLLPESWEPQGDGDEFLKSRQTDPDYNKPFAELVRQNGFSFESHPVTTDDGYILNVFRVTSPQHTKPGAKVVFLQHGIVDSADCWVIHRPELAPAFQLVREGYDVWLGNQRGTKHSMGHQTLDVDSKKFWEFSWTEMGDHDATAQVDFVRKHTGAAKVTYVGHSQGTTQMFYALTEPGSAWSDRLNLFVALAPVTKLDHTSTQLMVYFAQAGPQLQDILYALHVYHLLDGWQTDVMQAACKALPPLCRLAEGFLITKNPLLDDPDRFNVYMGHFPGGASVQSLIHYAQMIDRKSWALYDWGSKEANQQHYAQDAPPEVNLANLNPDVPIAMFVGTEDDLGDPTDARWARETMETAGKPLVHYEEVKAGHATFMAGKDMYYFKNVLDLIAKYNI